MIHVTIDVQGLADLDEQLSKLVNAAGENQIHSALMDASLPMVKKMRQRAAGNPQANLEEVQRDDLSKAIARKRIKTADGVAVGIYIKPNAFDWRVLEYGTPRTAAEPFIRNSFDENAPAAVDIFKSRLRDNIEKIKQRQALAEAENAGAE